MSKSGGSTTRHVIEVMYQVTGLDKAGAGITSLNKSVTQGQTTLDKFGVSATKASNETTKLSTAAKNVAPSIEKTAGSTQKLDKSLTKSGNAAKGLAEKFRGNRGLIFSTTMLSSGVFEAIGMFQGWTDASEKLSTAQQRVNDLEERGMENTKEYGDALKDLEDAQRGYNFTTRFTIQSFADLIPMSLMLISSVTDLSSKFMEGASTKEKFAAASTKVVGALRSVGDAMMQFTTRHPFLLLLTLLAAAVTAVIFNFGGFRDRLNEVGVALGNAIPGLKGFLDWLGEIGNGFSNSAMAALGYSQKTTEAVQSVRDEVLKTGDATKLSIDEQIELYHQLGEESENVAFSLSTHLKMQQDEQKRHSQRYEQFVSAITSGNDEMMKSAGFTAEEYKELYKEWQDNIKDFESRWNEHVDNVVENYKNFEEAARESQESQAEELEKLGQKLTEHYAKREEIRDKEGKDQDEAMEKWEEEKNAILAAISEIEGGLSDMAIQARDDWAEFASVGEEAMERFRLEAVGGNFQAAIDAIVEGMAMVPDKYQENMTQANSILDNELLSAESRADIFVAHMDKLDPFQSFIVGAHEYTKAQAEVTSGLDELAVAARANVSESSEMAAAWDNFVASMTPAQKNLPIVKSAIEGVNKGAIDASTAFGMVEAAGVKMSEQLKTTVTRSFEDLSKIIIDLPGPMTAVFANIGGQIQKVGEVTDQSLVQGPKSVVGSMKKTQIEGQTLAQSISKELGINATSHLKTFSTKAGTESSVVITKLQGLGGEMKKTSTTTKTETSSWTSSLSNFAKSASSSIDGVIKSLSSLWQKVKEGAGGIWEQITKFFSGGGIKDAFASGGEGGGGMNFLPFVDTTLFKTKLDEMKNLATQTTAAVSAQFVTMETSIKGTFGRIGAIFPTAFTQLQTSASQTTAQASAAFVTMETSVKGTITRIAAVFPTAFTQLYTVASQATSQASTTFMTMETSIKGTFTRISSSFPTAFSTLFTAASQATSQASAAFTTMEASINGTLGRINASYARGFVGLQPAANSATTQASVSFTTMEKSIGSTLTRIASKFPTAFNQLYSAAVQATGKAIGAFGQMEKAVVKSLSQMQSKVQSFGSAAASSFQKVGQQADAATKKVQGLQKAINSLKDKRINVYVGLTGPGARFMRHGGSFISPEPTGFAASGKTWINSKPRKIGGVNISEFGKPELVTVTPLSDPGNPMDKGINLGMNVPKPQPIPSAVGANPFNGVGGGGQRQPIQVKGNLYVTVRTQNGKVLAQEVQPYLLDDFSGVT